jgi:uncharacterized protein with HEPN domain
LIRTDTDHVHEILGCVDAIDHAEAVVLRYSHDVEVAQVALDAVRHRVLEIAGAVSALSLEMREDHPAVPWSVMTRMGDLLGHSDDNLDPQIAVAALSGPLKHLRSACQSIVGESVRWGRTNRSFPGD